MKKHPFTESISIKVSAIAAVSAATLILWVFARLYAGLSMEAAVVATIFYVTVLTASGIFYWFIAGFIRVLFAKLTIALLVQAIAIGIVFIGLHIFSVYATGTFMRVVPLFVIFGTMFWIILVQWYGSLPVDTSVQNDFADIAGQTESGNEKIDRITVRQGTEIHIFRVDEVLYIEAYGDYVMLYSENGRYIKEQTMHWFEDNLPQEFVRIHRSSIVNTDRIARVELFGKEKYNVRLKNGVNLRASVAGYKLLKQRLSL